MTEQATGVVEHIEDLDVPAVFTPHRDQVMLAVRVPSVFSTLDLGLITQVIDAANQAGFSLARTQSFREDWLLCVFDSYAAVFARPATPPTPTSSPT
ncbi:hypothetical protein MXD59_09855 [Frankia sp. Ag45/Mut15]|uniref:Uncharacterized protein n=1 Tax=Frankia umida TaxID=573489 RepID=A0ABT0JWZ8_9ACTN|nr:hypothetical protein [Frankia umida]MCK9876076.1 hypothetical protein [Frankia umida]